MVFYKSNIEYSFCRWPARETEPADMSDEIADLKKEVRTLKRSQDRLSKKLAEAKTRSDMFHWGTASGQDKVRINNSSREFSKIASQ